jgi:hypothetical protein
MVITPFWVNAGITEQTFPLALAYKDTGCKVRGKPEGLLYISGE